MVLTLGAALALVQCINVICSHVQLINIQDVLIFSIYYYEVLCDKKKSMENLNLSLNPSQISSMNFSLKLALN